jgi:GNAT superfamily N-acetyltransferase
MILRPSRPGDAGALAAIFHRAVQIGAAGHYSQAQRDGWSPDCPTPEVWAHRLEGLTTIVAEIDGEPQGFLSMRDDDGLIDLLFVAPERIGLGLGFALYCRALDHCRARGLGRLHAEASSLSRDFFRRQGWVETGQRNRGRGRARIVTTLMACDLTAAGGS